jgi:hypothetical protein
MLHQPSLRPALFAGCRADGDVGSRMGIIWGDVRDRTDVVLCMEGCLELFILWLGTFMQGEVPKWS